MIRGTAAQFKFQLPYSEPDIGNVKIVFWQDNYKGPTETRKLPIIKQRGQCSISGKELSVTLNQEETLRFTDMLKGKVQLWAEASVDGDIVPFGSRERQFTVYPIFDDSIIGDWDEPIEDEEGWTILDAGEIG